MTITAHIAGAGLGGLAVALALAKGGASVRVFERADTLSEVGAGIQLSPNAMRVVRVLGLEEQIIDAGFQPQAAVIRDGLTGRTKLDAPLADVAAQRYGAPYINIHRADLHAILLAAAMDLGVVIETGAVAQGYEINDRRARFLMDVDVGEADILVGADGIRSATRAQMVGEETPRFTGNVAWRGVIPSASLPSGHLPPDATVWAGPGRHFVTYFLRGGELLNFVAVEERSDWRDESWTRRGDPAELREAFSGWRPEIEEVLSSVDTCFLWALFDRAPLPRWTDGPVALLGDACHPMPPFMAQGAAMAFEDAYVLAQCVGAGGDLSAALSRYEALRKPRTSRVQARARANADLFHMNGLGARFRLAVTPFLRGEIALKPLDWIYGFDPTKRPPGRGWS